MNENMSIEEMELLIIENNKKISKLKEKIEPRKKENTKIQDIMELLETKNIYDENRRILGNAILLDLTEDEFDSIEATMPIYEQKIKYLEDKLKI
ncbi:MAG: hypothetical protein JXQ66_04315 [Campylobacterales bacterium]|nr:hypothetical protein [Campylobacterales bacterium]